MGLDMYLSARRYVGDWAHGKDEERSRYRYIAKAAGVDGWRCEGSPHLTVEMSVAYWRKANQIHNWFVENVQEGNDDCKDYYVSREELGELRDTCKAVLAASKLVAGKVVNGQRATASGWENITEEGEVIEDPSTAQKLLPTQKGFFFGSDDYDQGYIEDLKNTVEQIDAVLLRFAEGWEFQYCSSW